MEPAAGIGELMPEALPTGSATRAALAGVRVVVALMWIQNLNWKIPVKYRV